MSTLGEHRGNGIRFDMHLSAPNGGVAQMLCRPEGQWVSWSEYDKLQAEVERLTIERNGFEQAMKANQSILETKRDTIERLRKAGDAMASSIQFNEEMEQDYNGPTIVRQCVKDWNAAKEGKSQP